MFVEDGKSPSAISVLYDGKPSHQTVLNWAGQPNADGDTWYMLQRKLRDARYRAASPEALGLWIVDAIGELLSKGKPDSKTADALMKFVKAMRELLEPRYIMSMHYHTLTQLIAFLLEEGLGTPETLQAIRAFKDRQYAALIPPDGGAAPVRFPVPLVQLEKASPVAPESASNSTAK